MKFDIKEHFEVLTVETDNGIFKRISKPDKQYLIWQNDYKTYQYDYLINKWNLYTKRKGLVESFVSIPLEIEYQKYIRKEKLKIIIDFE